MSDDTRAGDDGHPHAHGYLHRHGPGETPHWHAVASAPKQAERSTGPTIDSSHTLAHEHEILFPTGTVGTPAVCRGFAATDYAQPAGTALPRPRVDAGHGGIIGPRGPPA